MLGGKKGKCRENKSEKELKIEAGKRIDFFRAIIVSREEGDVVESEEVL